MEETNYHELAPAHCENDGMVDLLDKIPDGVIKHIEEDSKSFVNDQKEYILKNKLRKFTNRQRKSFAAEVITHSRRMELKSYELCLKWKREFRYDLVKDFRETVSTIRRHLIYGYTTIDKYKDEKLFQYNRAQAELDELENIMWLMIQPQINIMSNIEWAEIAYEVDTINIMLEKLICSLRK